MRKVLILSVVTVLLLCAAVPSYAQAPATDDKPTFYRLTPGVYVNGWPRFTITYPKDWVERFSSVERGAVFVASSPGGTPHPTVVRVIVSSYPSPLDKWAGTMEKFYNSIGMKDVTLVSDKPTQLRDGTPAREVEFRMVVNTVPRIDMNLVTKKGDVLIFVSLQSLDAKIEEDLKAILHSIEFQPDKDGPVKVPPDVQEFFDKHNNDLLSHDLVKLMIHYSDQYLNSGVKKGKMERFFRQFISVPTKAEVGITEFVPAGDRAYLAGFAGVGFGKGMLFETSIIKENGEWKWYGNQRDVVPDPRFQ